MYDEILVLDFGSQYNQLIARRIREFGVFSELKPYDISIEEIKSRPNLKGIIFSGGPNSVYDKNALYCNKEIYKLGIPILGICYGMQLMSFDLGGKIEPSNEREYGGANITCKTDNLFFDYCDILKCFVYYFSKSENYLNNKILKGNFISDISNYCPIIDVIYPVEIENCNSHNIINIPKIIKRNKERKLDDYVQVYQLLK